MEINLIYKSNKYLTITSFLSFFALNRFRRLQSTHIAFGIVSALIMTGCATYKDYRPGTVREIPKSQPSAIVEITRDKLPVTTDLSPESLDYKIGADDILSISVFGRPDLGTSPGTPTGKTQGLRVDHEGKIRLPLIGSISLAGLTTAQAESRLRESYKGILQDPWITVDVLEFRSHPLYLFGQFKKSGIVYMDKPMNLLQGISLAEGFDSSAYLPGARVSRGGKILPVDIYELLANGDQRYNIWLQPGDSIYLPDKSNLQVFIFGAVKKAGPLPFVNGQLSLSQAIASADPILVGSAIKYVRIIRSISPTSGELIIVDFDRIMSGDAPPFMLAAGDVVFLPRSTLGTWNDALGEIMPSLQAVSTLLQPYVTIKYLTNNRN